MFYKFSLWLALIILSSCSFLKPKPKSDYSKSDLEIILDRAEEKASPEGRIILATSRNMIAEREILVGSCWDYINAVYNRADYPAHKRIMALKNKKRGPYANVNTIQPGDWLYFINHSFSAIEHSGIFVEWTNVDKKKGLIMSYIGGKKKSPATYKNYNLKNVYYIIRPKP